MTATNPKFSTGICTNPGTIREGYHIDPVQSVRELELVRELASLPDAIRRLEIYRELAELAPARWSW
jgi:hypothetical protein